MDGILDCTANVQSNQVFVCIYKKVWDGILDCIVKPGAVDV